MKPTNTSKRQGFARLSIEERKANASMGGKAARNRHRWSSEEATEAGRKGRGKRRSRVGFKEEL